MHVMANKSRSCSDGVSRTPNSIAGGIAAAPAVRSATTTSCAETLSRAWRRVSTKSKSFRLLRVLRALYKAAMSATMELAAPHAGASTFAPPGRSLGLPRGAGAGSALMSPASSPQQRGIAQRPVFWEIFLRSREQVAKLRRNACGNILHNETLRPLCVIAMIVWREVSLFSWNMSDLSAIIDRLRAHTHMPHLW